MNLLIDRVPAIVANPFPAKGDPPPLALRRVVKACDKAGIEIVVQDLATNLAGDVRRTPERATEFCLRLNLKHTEAQQFGTLAHELAHVFCGHLGPDRAELAPNRDRPELDVREFEAEAVAYLVSDRMNLDIGSVAYLSGYLQPGKPLPNYSLDAVLKAAGKIEEMAAGKFRLKKKPSIGRS